MKKPTLGRIVLYRDPDPTFKGFNSGSDTAPAIIARVISDTVVNLKVLPDGTGVYHKKHIPLKDTAEGAVYWQWPELVEDQPVQEKIPDPDPPTDVNIITKAGGANV